MSNVKSVVQAAKKVSDSDVSELVAMLPNAIAKIGNNDKILAGGVFQVKGDYPAVLLECLGIVYYLARKYCLVAGKRATTRAEKWDDCLQVGLVELCKAYVLYCPAKGVKFSTFAFKLVGQAIRNEIRHKNAPLYVMGNGENSVRELLLAKMVKGKKESTRLLNKVRYNPDTIDNSLLRSEGIDGIDGIPYAGQFIMIRFDEIPSFDILPCGEGGTAPSNDIFDIIRAERLERFNQALKGLKEGERKTLLLRQEGFNDVQIAEQLGTTKVTVGQWRKNATEYLKVHFQG